MDYIVFGKPHIGEEDIAEVVDSLRKGWLGTGPKVKQFEEGFRAYVGARHAVALHSCTAALFLGQLALGIGDGDAVVTTPLTFVATASSIRHTGALPLFADVEEHTGLLDPAAVERLLREDCRVDPVDGRPIHTASGRKVRAILPVHLWGQPADMDAFRALCERYHLLLVEDAAHAIETTVGTRKVGSGGTADLSCFSFYSTKNLCTGEGGMVTTSNEQVAQRVRMLSSHGLSADAWKRFSSEGYRHYLALESGWKFNMMDLQAALGIHQLARLEAMHVERTRQWHAYRAELSGVDAITLPSAEAKHGRHARHLFVLELTGRARLDRDALLSSLHARGVGAGVHYLAVSGHPAFADAMNVPVPRAEKLGRTILSIPLGGALTEPQRQRVSTTIRDLLA